MNRLLYSRRRARVLNNITDDIAPSRTQLSTRRVVTVTSALVAALVATLFLGGCESHKKNTQSKSPQPNNLALGQESNLRSIRFFEDRIKGDPDDFVATNKLAALYLQKLRETGSLDFLVLASKTAEQSLRVMPEDQNIGGLAALTQAEFASHEFANSRDHALRLAQLDPEKAYPYSMLGDSLLELGDYDKATQAYDEMERRSPGINSETRLGRLALLQGDPQKARHHLELALVEANNLTSPNPETTAWCYWQLGEIDFSIGNYTQAEKDYRDSLSKFPGYYRAEGGLGKALAAKGDTSGAIAAYEQATRSLPDPLFIAALGDLYKLTGQDAKAAGQYSLVEQIARLSALNGSLYNRQLATFYADHDMNPDIAYQDAKREFQARRDIYGSDALAWTALKAGRIQEAQNFIRDAMKLGVRDARVFFHAGMIAKAVGNNADARRLLERAVQMNPQFDPLLSRVAVATLDQLRSAS